MWKLPNLFQMLPLLRVQLVHSTNRQRLFATAQTKPNQQKLPIAGVDNIILVSSAKGGVGKSTVAVNLALSLKQRLQSSSNNGGGYVGLLDADVFGPSIPKMVNLEGLTPEIDQRKRILPLASYGLKCMSIGFLVDPNSAVVWRGLMVMSAIQQMLRQVAWGPLHTLVIDMPPGTGDVQLSISQNVPVTGAVIVTTPQQVAVADTRRGIEMLRKVNVPLIGLMENMSGYLCPSCGHHDPILADSSSEEESGGSRLASDAGLPLLGRLPINSQLARSGDSGRPLVVDHPESPISHTYTQLADRVIAFIDSQRSRSGESCNDGDSG